MATAERAYNTGYAFDMQAQNNNAFPERKYSPERVRRTREKPQVEVKRPESAEQTAILTHAVLRRLIMLFVFVGIVLIGIILMNAYAADVKCSINSLVKQNASIEDEINTLNIKIESANTVEEIQEYATGKLGMRYPQANQMIYIKENSEVSADLSKLIRQKIYD